jgi:hypothetical protein
MDDMEIFVKSTQMLRWLLPHCQHFPKAERFATTKRLQDAAFDFQETLYLANAHSGRTRLNHLQSADAHLNKLRLYLRLAHEWGWLTGGQYAHVSAMVTELGKMLGGWMRATRG